MVEQILEVKRRCKFAREIGKKLNINEKEMDSISFIAEHDGLSLKALSGKIGLSVSRGSRIVSRLKEKGFISIHQNDMDRRIMDLSLTGEGWNCSRQMEREKAECNRKLLVGLSRQERESVKKGLDILLRVL